MRQEAYQFAYEEASAELGDIVGEFEQLRLQKERLEQVVAALRPFLGLEAEHTASDQQNAFLRPEPVQQLPEPVAFPMQLVREPSPMPIEFASEPSPDPFQRRIDSVLWDWSRKREGMATA
jgi:hypothetical protein